jgi:hypothetical protein
MGLIVGSRLLPLLASIIAAMLTTTKQGVSAVPTTVPSKLPTSKPTPRFYCGCSTCTDTFWNMLVTDGGGSYTCGERITYLQSAGGGSKSLYDSCKQVGEEFPLDKCGPACNPSLCNKLPLDDPDPSTLIWSDEFNVDGPPDPLKWGYDLGDGCPGLCNWGNGEQAYYTALPGNVNISNGVLRIAAKKESGYSLPYTSARIVTRGLHSFKYGRIQFRASLAKCKAVGTWAALWMVSFSFLPFLLGVVLCVMSNQLFLAFCLAPREQHIWWLAEVR